MQVLYYLSIDFSLQVLFHMCTMKFYIITVHLSVDFYSLWISSILRFVSITISIEFLYHYFHYYIHQYSHCFQILIINFFLFQLQFVFAIVQSILFKFKDSACHLENLTQASFILRLFHILRWNTKPTNCTCFFRK